MPELNDEQWKLIDAEIVARRTISALKIYRAVTGSSLKEARDAVEPRQERRLLLI